MLLQRCESLSLVRGWLGSQGTRQRRIRAALDSTADQILAGTLGCLCNPSCRDVGSLCPRRMHCGSVEGTTNHGVRVDGGISLVEFIAAELR